MPDATELRTGDPAQVAGYRIVRRLGQGGQGVVFLALGADGQKVAIKQLRQVEDKQARRQFAKEVAAARRVAPFCTARVISFDLDGEKPHVVSEFIEGPSLQRLVRDSGPMTGTRLERLAIGTVTALAAIHQAGVVHRDFKPANVMVSPDGPRVIDFGIARDMSSETTVTSRIFGTPAYMAPEQIRNERVSPQTDMFAWASVVAFAATGRAPFDAGHMMAVVHRITTMEPMLDGVPDALVDVLLQCLAKDAKQRPTAQQALAMLLGRPTPDQDVPNPTAVLAEGSRFAQASTAGKTHPADETVPTPVTQQAKLKRAKAEQEKLEQAKVAQAKVAEKPVVPVAPVASVAGPDTLPTAVGVEIPRYGTPVTLPDGSPLSARPLRKNGFGSSVGAVVAVLVLAIALVAGGAIVVRTLLDHDASTPSGQGETPAPVPTTDGPPTGGGVPSSTDDSAFTLPAWADGVWTGTIVQPLGGVAKWDVSITLDADATTGRMTSRDLGCDGVLTYSGGSGDSIEMATLLENDLWDQCSDDSSVRLRHTSDNELTFDWVDNDADGNTAYGTLTSQ
ncbi:serine/threonine-protein kinase [Kineosporia sp. NBRC 101731]|uniref:serine/threonine-protein kinase n=1 Tax=Kineosporia sp. NBRC 101731 TaxID=3032199 RepID=UPI002553EDA1|nr:serine/threonine-protein kinase [Kineosporia sp. NBRC 101731]